MERQESLLPETGALVVDTGAPFCCFEMTGKPRGKGALRFRPVIPADVGRMIDQGRPPHGWRKRIFAQGYTDPETVAYMEALALCARATMRSKALSVQPIALLLHAFMPIPVSWPKRKQQDALIGAIRPTPKPDWDNIGKATDALTGIVWRDDAPVVDGHVIKLYSDSPGLRVEVREFVPPRRL